MYSFSHVNLFLMFALFFSNLPLTFAHSPQSFTIITEEWPPYNYIENHRLTGFSTEVIKLVMKDLKRNEKIFIISVFCLIFVTGRFDCPDLQNRCEYHCSQWAKAGFKKLCFSRTYQ